MSPRHVAPCRAIRRGRSASSAAVPAPRATASLEPLERRRLLSVSAQAEMDFRLIGITGNQQSALSARYPDETLFDVTVGEVGADPAFLDGFSDASGAPVTVLTTVGGVPDTIPGVNEPVTQGTGALRVDVPQNSGAYWGFQSPNVADLLRGGAQKLEYDLTLIGRELNGGSFTATDNAFSGYAQSNRLAISLGDGTWIERDFPTAGSDNMGLSGEWRGQDITQHVTWDLTQFLAPGDVPLADYITANNITDARILFVTQGEDAKDAPTQGPMRFYFDNFVMTRLPPPNSAAFQSLFGDFDPVATTKLKTLTFVPDSDAIGYNPDDGMLYRTSGASSYRDDPTRIGYNDNHYMSKVDLATFTETGVFNANYEGDGTTGPYGVPAPRPSFLLPAERRTPDQRDPAIGDMAGPGEYHALRDLTYSTTDDAFYGADDDGLFKVTPAGTSEKLVGDVFGGGGPKGITFATVNGERRLLVSQRDSSTLYSVNPADGGIIDSVSLVYADDGTSVLGVLSLVAAPDGSLYGIANRRGTPFSRELIRIDPATGEATALGALGMHMADLAIVPLAGPPVVSEVYVRGTAPANPAAPTADDWTAEFKSYLETIGRGDDAHGYRVFGPNLQPAPANPEGILPWINMRQIVVRYSAAPTGSGIPTPATLSVSGARNGAYTVAAVTPVAGDPTAFVVTLDKPLGGGSPTTGARPTTTENGDLVTITVPGGGAGGSNYTLRLNVLQGDTYHDDETVGGTTSHTVNANDFSDVKKRFFKSTTNVGTGATAYSVFHDVDGNGTINAFDFSEVKKRFFQNLPAPTAPAPSPLEGASITSQVFGASGIL